MEMAFLILIQLTTGDGGCATSSQLDYLRSERLVDCSSEKDMPVMPFETPSVSTCGNVLHALTETLALE
jgi:hypothetical protein